MACSECQISKFLARMMQKAPSPQGKSDRHSQNAYEKWEAKL